MLRFLKKKRYRIPLFSCDIHCHLLPKVDDGSCSAEETLEILSFLKGRGVKTLFFTPHVMADYPMNNAMYLKECFRSFMEQYVCPAKEKFPRIGLAAEYMLDEGFVRHLDEGLLTYDGSHVLVEMPCLQVPLDLEEKLYKIQLYNYIPVLAHPERYFLLLMPAYQSLKEQGCKFQLNMSSLQGFYGTEVRSNAEWLLNNGMYDFVGSDIHSSAGMYLYSDFFLKKKYAGRVNELIIRTERSFCSFGEEGDVLYD